MQPVHASLSFSVPTRKSFSDSLLSLPHGGQQHTSLHCLVQLFKQVGESSLGAWLLCDLRIRCCRCKVDGSASLSLSSPLFAISPACSGLRGIDTAMANVCITALAHGHSKPSALGKASAQLLALESHEYVSENMRSSTSWNSAR